MVKAKVIAAFALLALVSCGQKPAYEWHKYKIDAHRTGVGVPSADNVAQVLGSVENGVYTAPNGRQFQGGSTPEVAALLIGVQPEMARLKEVVAHAPKEFKRSAPECELFNFIVDRLAADVQRAVGRKVDFAFTNTGGIRVDLPSGEILLDEIVSMLPFKNYLTYVEIPGSEVRGIFEQMASTRPQCISGARVVIKDGKLLSAEIGGKPIDDKAWYGVATIDFLLDGGDGYKLARGARRMIITKEKIGDAILRDIRAIEAAGKPFEYFTDGRIKVEE